MYKTSMKKLLILVAAAAGVLAFSSCQTMEGVGKDISAGGQALSGAASR